MRSSYELSIAKVSRVTVRMLTLGEDVGSAVVLGVGDGSGHFDKKFVFYEERKWGEKSYSGCASDL